MEFVIVHTFNLSFHAINTSLFNRLQIRPVFIPRKVLTLLRIIFTLLTSTAIQPKIKQNDQMKTLTLTQSEELKIGQRGKYLPRDSKSKHAERLQRLGIEQWVEKRKKTITESERLLGEFIDIPSGYELVYGITYKGKDFVCGDLPRDLGSFVRGLESGLALAGS